MSGGTLVLGGTQPLGQRLCARLAAAGHRVVAVGVEPEGAVPLPDGVAYRAIDLGSDRARAGLADAVRDLGETAIVHLAFHRVARSAPGLDVEATRRLLRFAEDHPAVRHLVHWSTADVYAQSVGRPYVLREDHPLELDPRAPAWVRDRVASDLTVSARMGLASSLTVTVLRCAEILAPDMGSQLLDWLGSRVCLRPMGFDPILNLLSLEDAARAFALALATPTDGAFNVRGADTLPLSWVSRLWGRVSLPVPGPMLGPLYAARRLLRRSAFRYGPNAARFHYNGVLDGARAARVLGYRPSHPIDWPAGPPGAPVGGPRERSAAAVPHRRA